jgi:multidrug efflux system membrane fusion protein
MTQQTPTAFETARPSVTREAPKTPPRKSSGGKWIWLVVLVLLGGAAYYYYPKFKASQSTASQGSAGGGKKGRGGAGAIPVVAAKVQRGNIGVYVDGLGAVTPIYTVTVKSRVDGQLMQILYKEGQVVNKGDLLLEIDPRPYQVQLQQAEGQLLHDQALLKNANIDLERYKVLWSQDAIPQQQLATQEATVNQYEGTIKTDQAAVENAKLNLVYCHIASPITGIVGLRLVDPGNIVHASDANGLLVITQLDPISVIFTISEDQLPPVLAKMRAGVKLGVEAWDRELKRKLAQGTLETLDNQIDQTTGTLRARAIFENKNGALYPSQFVNARLLVEEKTGITLVQNAAIQRNRQNIYVWAVKPDQTATAREITVGVTEGDVTEVTSGLQPGDVTITVGVDKLQEGGRVSPKFDGGKSAGAGAAAAPSGSDSTGQGDQPGAGKKKKKKGAS